MSNIFKFFFVIIFAVSLQGSDYYIYEGSFYEITLFKVYIPLPSAPYKNVFERILTSGDDEQLLRLDAHIKELFLIESDEVLARKVDPISDIEHAIKDKEDIEQLWSLNDYFPDFIKDNFNRFASFYGPNCFNSALILAGALSPYQRYVDTEEFTFYLNHFFYEVNEPHYMDVIVYFKPSDYTPQHAATYLALLDLAFEKPSYKHDRYQVLKYNEWEESDGATYETKFYRIRDEFAFFEPQRIAQRIAQSFVDAVIDLGPQRKLHTLGIASEGLLSKLSNEFSTREQNDNVYDLLIPIQLKSIREQINHEIEKRHFSSPIVSTFTRYKNLWFDVNAHTKKIIGLVLEYLDKPHDENSINEIVETLQREVDGANTPEDLPFIFKKLTEY